MKTGRRIALGVAAIAALIVTGMALRARLEREDRILRDKAWELRTLFDDDSVQHEYAKNLLLIRGESAGDEVVKWLTRAAPQGHVQAQYQLGLILYEGKLVPRDNVAAGQWILLAAGGGHNEAKHLLKEMEIFLSGDKLVEARKRANAFKPVGQHPQSSATDTSGRPARETRERVKGFAGKEGTNSWMELKSKKSS